MQDLKRDIEHMDFTKDEIKVIVNVLQRKLRKMEAKEHADAKKKARDVEYVAQDAVVQQLIVVMQQHERNGMVDAPWQGGLDDHDYVWDVLYETGMQPTHPQRWYKFKEDEVVCVSEECWYLDMNPDRMDEHTYTYQHLDDEGIVYCDVCIDNLDDGVSKHCMECERNWICQALVRAIKIKCTT